MARWTCRLKGLLAAGWMTPSLLAFSLLDWNVAGNGAAEWNPTSPQVAAIGHHVQHLNADIITLQETPYQFSDRMPAFVAAYLPGYHLAMNSGTDGYIRSAILSRYPINRSRSWLDDAPLDSFGYGGSFTRDLFEAEIAVPGFDTPIHIFTAHLKNGSDATSATRRGAEAGAVSNFFVNVFLPQHAGRPYALTGDFNEDVERPGTNSRDAVPRLANDATGLRLTRPTNPVTGSERTWPSDGDFLFVRYDYILPSASLYARLFRSEVFRSSQLSPLPAAIQPGDEALASDHLPVLMIFRNPDNGPFALALRRVANESPQLLQLSWPAWPGYTYQVLRSADLKRWFLDATLSPAGGSEATWPVAVTGGGQFIQVRRIP